MGSSELPALDRVGRLFGGWLPSLRTRLVVLITGLFLALTAVMIVVASYLDLRDEETRSIGHTRSIGATVSRLAVPHLMNHHYLILEQELESIAASGIVQIAHVYDPQRQITVDADPQTSYFDDIPVDPLILKALQEGADQQVVSASDIKMAFPVRGSESNEILGAALVTVARSDPEGVIWSIWQRNTTIAFVLLMFGVPVAFHFGSSFLRPIDDLTQTAHFISAGNFDAPFPVDRRDEIGVLARTYRDMIGTIGENMEQIHKLAFIDSVTGLPNREYFRQHFLKHMAGRDGVPERMAVLFIDLDRFKLINDSYGHDCGDLLLQGIGARFRDVLNGFSDRDAVAIPLVGKRAFEDGDTGGPVPIIARLGGDEFAVILPVANEEEAAEFAERLVSAVDRPVDVNGIPLTVGASIGVAVYPDDGQDYTTILKNADIAMYAAKKAGGNSRRFYGQVEGDIHSHDRMRLEAELRSALREDQMTVFFQPKVDCATTKVVGAEVLARWSHPELGLLAPGAFIDVAEETGLITRLGERVLALACVQGKAWIDEGNGLPLAVNVSVRQLECPDFTRHVLEILERTGFPPEMLELEVTETVAMADPVKVRESTGPLRQAGIRFAIDDFGTGYSSLAHLQNLPFDTFKIDRSFISGIESEDNSRLIVQTILAMAKSLNYEVVAEGVETFEQQLFLREHGCSTAQGYLFGAPMAADMFAAWRQAVAGSPAAETAGDAPGGSGETAAA